MTTILVFIGLAVALAVLLVNMAMGKEGYQYLNPKLFYAFKLANGVVLLGLGIAVYHISRAGAAVAFALAVLYFLAAGWKLYGLYRPKSEERSSKTNGQALP